MLRRSIGPMLTTMHWGSVMTAMLAISTPFGVDNWFSRFITNRGPKIRRLTNRIHVDLHCQTCKDAKIPADQCDHNSYQRPAHNTTRGAENAKILMGEDDAAYAEEMAGAIAGKERGVFAPEWIARFIDSEAVDLSTKFGKRSKVIVHTFFDPNGGGSSEAAMVSVIVSPKDSTVYLVGMESVSCKIPTDVSSMITSYFEAMMIHPALRKLGDSVRYTMFVERNYGGQISAHQIFNLAAAVVPGLIRYSESRDMGAGVWTSDSAKVAGVHLLISTLGDNRLRMIRPLVTGHPPSDIQVMDKATSYMSHRTPELKRRRYEYERIQSWIVEDKKQPSVQAVIKGYDSILDDVEGYRKRLKSLPEWRRHEVGLVALLGNQLENYKKVATGGAGGFKFTGKSRTGKVADDLCLCLHQVIYREFSSRSMLQRELYKR